MGVVEILLSVAFPLIVGLGWSLVLSNASSNEILFARACFLIAALDVAGLTVYWLYTADRPSLITRLILSAVAGAVIFPATIGSQLWVSSRIQSAPKVNPSVASVEPTASTTTQDIPITAAYRLLPGLPIEVPANTTVNVLQIYPAKDQPPWFFQVGNSGTKRIFWPAQKLKPMQAMGFVYRGEVINLGQSPVINVVLEFIAEYKRDVPDTNHPGQSSSGPIVAKGIHRVMIGLLRPNTPFTFYIVNQSPFHVTVTPPTSGRLQTPGDSTSRSVPLVQPQASLEDLFSLSLMFTPSHYPWKGLPESVVH